MTQRRSDAPGTNAPSTKERILIAAATMLSEDPGARLTVRAVTARAGVSVGSLRHHFPTQRALQDAALDTIYGLVAPEDPIHEAGVSARDRLVNCLRQVLAVAGTGALAREGWGTMYRAFIEPEPTNEVRQAYLALEQEAHRRVERWLMVLSDEGALPKEDHTQRVKFLLTVLNGLSVERALPSNEHLYAFETATLYAAADATLTH